MNIIIPVAGEGTRLRPHTHVIPKSLLFVAGKPILGHILDNFKGLKISTLVIVLGEKGDAIINFCRKYRYNFKFVHQDKRLGLGHAMYIGSKGLRGPTMALLGDTIIDYDFHRFCQTSSNVLAVKAVDEPQRFGIVEVKGTKVTGLVEKPKAPTSNLAIVGLYYFQKIELINKAVDHIMRKDIKTKGEYQLTDALNYLLEKGENFNIVKIDKWYDCGTSAALIDTNRYLLQRTHHFKPKRKMIVTSPVYIHDSATITNAIIGPHVSIGENVTITNSLIQDSIINRGATVENALLNQSIIGEAAVVRGGLKKLNVSDSSIVEFP